MKTIVHVNQHNIRSNVKHNTNKPVLTCKTYKENNYGHIAIIRDDDGNEVGRFVTRMDKPLSCGARVWFETNLNVEVIDESAEHVEV